MIEAKADPTAEEFVAQLTRRAAALAEARAEEQRRANRADPLRWRSARLLWPLFLKG